MKFLVNLHVSIPNIFHILFYFKKNTLIINRAWPNVTLINFKVLVLLGDQIYVKWVLILEGFSFSIATPLYQKNPRNEEISILQRSTISLPFLSRHRKKIKFFWMQYFSNRITFNDQFYFIFEYFNNHKK